MNNNHLPMVPDNKLNCLIQYLLHFMHWVELVQKKKSTKWLFDSKAFIWQFSKY